MQLIASGFADVYVTTCQPELSFGCGFKEGFSMDPLKALKAQIPPFIFEADMTFDKKDMLTAMYYQRSGDRYSQLVRCTYGGVYVGILDIRPESKEYRKSKLFYISTENGKGVYIPEGFAVGFMSATDQAAVTVKMDRRYEPERNLIMTPFDPALGIKWPAKHVVVSVKDRYAPGFAEVERILCEDIYEQLCIDSTTLEIVDEEAENAVVTTELTEGMGQN